MKQDVEIFKAVDWALKHDQDSGLIDVLKALDRFARDAGINRWDIIDQIGHAIEQIEDYVPERKELHLITDLCKLLNS